MKKHLLTLSCLLATATLYAAPYPRLDPNSLINGTPEHPPITVNIPALQNALGNLSMQVTTRRNSTATPTANKPSTTLRQSPSSWTT